MTKSKAFWWVLIIFSALVSLMAFGWLAGAGPVEVCGGQMQNGQPLFQGCRTDWNWGTAIPIAMFFLASVAAFVGWIVGLRNTIRRNRTSYLHMDVD